MSRSSCRSRSSRTHEGEEKDTKVRRRITGPVTIADRLRALLVLRSFCRPRLAPSVLVGLLSWRAGTRRAEPLRAPRMDITAPPARPAFIAGGRPERGPATAGHAAPGP